VCLPLLFSSLLGAAFRGLLPRTISVMASHQRQQALPVINIALLGDKDPAARALVVQDIARACLDDGCFQVRVTRAHHTCMPLFSSSSSFKTSDNVYTTPKDANTDTSSCCTNLKVINHGVSKIVMDGALEAASEFFDMSTGYKEVHASDDIRSPVRYDTTSRDGISKSRSFLKHYANPLDDWINLWPMQPATYRYFLIEKIY
jgi:isopenicillin N synthase-like dioxygenase